MTVGLPNLLRTHDSTLAPCDTGKQLYITPRVRSVFFVGARHKIVGVLLIVGARELIVGAKP